MTTETEKFSTLVKKVRKQLGISQEDLAHALGVSFATVNRWENAKTSIYFVKIKKKKESSMTDLSTNCSIKNWPEGERPRE